MLQTIFVTLMGMLETPVPFNFVSNLYYMGVGMLAIIFVMGVLIGITTLLNKFFSRKKKDKDNK
ncbi:MAG: hypothetical protein E7528_03805 [Ruminococcaceae bacterium]|nr:hypothetical protein [Oscillospiraceae bacterium]